ncbi:ABC transporter permease [Aeromicrobium alkaliterrae]|uniref:ABC transporter permease n=2 Tax=Aeromicrobium alkaliterrae TaxID=302168 RepID=A0ABP4WC86_9ACTN
MRRSRGRKPLLGALGVALALIAWHLVTTVGGVQATVLPEPLDVLRSLGDNRQLLLDNVGYTLRTILIGFALSVVIGVSLAVAMRASSTVDGLLTPVIVGIQTVPKIALLPVILAWFGIGQTSGLVIVVLITVFPILVNTRLGFSGVDEEFRSLGSVMGGSRARTFWTIEVPLALPAIFSGLEVGMTLAVTGAAGAEMFAGSEGIAFVMQVASSALRMDMAFAALTVLTVLGVVLYYATTLVAWALMPWTRGRS